MKDLLIALQFLTIIPVKIKDIHKPRPHSLIYFPIIGLLLGLILIVVSKLLTIFGFQQFIVNVILVILLIILTGGIHLDGLADTCDAFLSRKTKDEMLKIMQEPHIGVMGVLSIISILFLKIAFLSSVNLILKHTALLLMCILSRWSLVLAMFLFPYARKEGKAKIFIQGITFKIFSLATIIGVILAVLIWQIKGIIIVLITGAIAYLIGKFINRKLNGITGDTLGAMNELIEVIVLFSICLIK